MLLCQLTGTVPIEPVVTKNGIIYEKQHILNYLQREGKCPITGDSLKPSELLEIKSTNLVKPSTTFYLQDIKMLMKELEGRLGMLLEDNLRLKTERDEARKQLTHLLYLKDGATKVVAEQLEEIDLLKEQLNQKLDTSSNKKIKHDEIDDYYVRKIYTAISNLSKELVTERKQRAVKFNTIEELSQYKLTKYQINQNLSKIQCFDLIVPASFDSQKKFEPGLLTLGSIDGTISILDYSTQKIVGSIKKDNSPINIIKSILYPSTNFYENRSLTYLNASSCSPEPYASPMTLISGSADGSINIWSENKLKSIEDILWLSSLPCGYRYINDTLNSLNYQYEEIYKPHSEKAVVEIFLHPLPGILAACYDSQSIDLISIEKKSVISSYDTQDDQSNINSACFQPDGNLLIATTSDKNILVWDLRTQEKKLSLPTTSFQSSYTCSDFSEIGYIMACGTACGKILFWDLRKCVISHFVVVGEAIKKVLFDHSGKNLLTTTKNKVFLLSAAKKKKFEIVHIFKNEEETNETLWSHKNNDFFICLGDNNQIFEWK